MKYFLPLLALMFIGLKLTDHIDWSWTWVLAPLWGPLVFIIIILISITLYNFILILISSLSLRRKKVGHA